MHLPEIVSSPKNILDICQKLRAEGKSISLIPTMGALHEGHLSLVKKARSISNICIVSIFINPKQFGPNEDFNTYPRTLALDCKLLMEHNADYIFCPKEESLYPKDFQTKISAGEISTKYCGASRPGFFDGVLTVVGVLLNLMRPDYAVFGEKDFQQLALVKALVRDLWMPTEIISMPIVREPLGLALSSRNAYLSDDEKKHALCLFKAIKAVKKSFGSGETCCQNLEEIAKAIISNTPFMKLDYAHVIDSSTLWPLKRAEKTSRLILAAYVGKQKQVRLIDNAQLS